MEIWILRRLGDLARVRLDTGMGDYHPDNEEMTFATAHEGASNEPTLASHGAASTPSKGSLR